LILALKERSQENREGLNQLIKNKEACKSMISNLKNESLIHKQKKEVYENKLDHYILKLIKNMNKLIF